MYLPVVALDKQELSIQGGEEVVHDDVHPGAVLPELEVEDASVLLLIKPLNLKVSLTIFWKCFEPKLACITWSLGTSFLKMWGMVAAPTRAQRNQQLPSLPWFTSSLLEPSTTSWALGKRLLARTHLISEASVPTCN